MTTLVLRDITAPLGVFAELRKVTVGIVMSACRRPCIKRNNLTLQMRVLIICTAMTDTQISVFFSHTASAPLTIIDHYSSTRQSPSEDFFCELRSESLCVRD